MNILMVAAENDALSGGKVGGIGDVLRDIPPALAEAGHQLHVITPGYGAFSKLPNSKHVGSLQVMFSGHQQVVELFQVNARMPNKKVRQWVLEHPLFAAAGVGKIYCDDGDDRPFATDANKFALFSAAVAQAALDNQFGKLDVLHLHDWHAAMVAVLRAYDPAYRKLQSIHTVFTIHNLSLQGVRPLANDESSLQAWFPGLQCDGALINDPRARDCINPMRAGINLSDKVHVVSPTYAREVLIPSEPQAGFFGGEGLQKDLQQVDAKNRLKGILNGCEYPRKRPARLSQDEILAHCENALLLMMGNTASVASTHLIALKRIEKIREMNARNTGAADKPVLITSVGRLTDQKALLLKQLMPDGQTALDHLLARLGDHGFFIMLGSGDSQIEKCLTQVAARHANFIFMRGYAESLSQHLYSSGDLFLMPSSFEPCGISQMLAMRAGQPCVVHGVGGLSDTVQNDKNGFVFTGTGLHEQAQNMIECFTTALEMKLQQPKKLEKIAKAAAAERFLWSDAAQLYGRELYEG